MWPFTRGWGSHSKIAPWETTIFEWLAAARELQDHAAVIKQQASCARVFRKETGTGMTCTFSYPSNPAALPFEEYWRVGLLTDKCGAVSINVFSCRGQISYLEVTCSAKISNPKMFSIEGFSFVAFAPPLRKPIVLSGWVGDLFTEGVLYEPKPPLQNHLFEFDATCFPNDYLEFCEQVDGAFCGEHWVLGGSETVDVDGSYRAIIDFGHGEAVCVRDGRYYYFVEDDFVALTLCLKEILRRIALDRSLIED